MATYFETVVDLDDGPYPIISPTCKELTLCGHLDVTDIRTRAVFAFVRDTPHPVRWVSDADPTYYELTKLWDDRFGDPYFVKSTIPQDIPDSTLQYPIVINTERGEFFDGTRWGDVCPLPVLAASEAPGPLPAVSLARVMGPPDCQGDGTTVARY
jgi:hypothetical protein